MNFKIIYSNIRNLKKPSNKVIIAGVASIAIIVAIAFVAIQPSQILKDSRDARRKKDVNAILEAVYHSIDENKGAYPVGLTTGMSEMQLGTSADKCTVSTGGCAVTTKECIDLSTPLAKYFKSIPKDPNGGTAAKTKYSIVIDENYVVTVKACGSEGTTDISVSK